MTPNRPDDLSQFSMRDLFRMEADGQTQVLTDGLLALERGGADASALETMMRAAHSIKGAAAIVDLHVVVQLAHAMEDGFVAAQHGLLELTPARVDALLSGVDLIVQLARLDEAGGAAWMSANAGLVDRTLAAIGALGTPDEAPAAPVTAAPTAPPTAPEPLPEPAFAPRSAPLAEPANLTNLGRAPTAAPAPARAPAKGAPQNFDRLLSLASEARIHAHQMHPLIDSMQRFKRNQSSLIAAIEQLHEAIAGGADAGLKERSLLAQQKTQPLKQAMLQHLADLENYERRQLRVSQGLVDEVLALRMRPFRDGVHAFPRMVRDLARSLGKEVRLDIDGEDTLVDRDILTHIESPLNHILRNALDHGMEPPAARLAAGKPATGSIRIEARHRGGMLNIDISDDGRGIDLEAIRRAAVERAMVGAELAAALTPAELLEFLFLPAFSLKAAPDALSGRGVGLDVVHETIRQQNGTVALSSEPGRGFRIALTLPLTQSITRALVLEIGGEPYAIPIVNVERVLRVPPAALHTLENKQFFDYHGEHLGLVSAAQVLERAEAAGGAAELPVVLIGAGARRYALVVEAIRGEQSLAVQALDPLFGKLRNIAAGALLDSGEPVLILDVPDLLLSIDKLLREGALHSLADASAAAQRGVKRILVVDDSLTVREMERKLLQTRGFAVDVAIDGIDGWNAVRGGDYDLVISDVDMPRMDGIELVALIKKDPHLHALPVMIVSYKDRPEDRARGMAAGADYYLTKGSFHDATLLDAVADLIGEAAR
jgi:two-component system, chemotaxis family, sensor histidine kinase and response regulator WspE